LTREPRKAWPQDAVEDDVVVCSLRAWRSTRSKRYDHLSGGEAQPRQVGWAIARRRDPAGPEASAGWPAPGGLGPVLRERAGQRGRPILAGPLGQAPVHRRLRMPPQDAGAAVLGSSKGQRASAVARQGGGRPRNCTGARCWARGYAVSTVGLRPSSGAPLSSLRSSATPKARMRQVRSHNVTGDSGSPEGCSQPSSPPLCGGVMTTTAVLARTGGTHLHRLLRDPGCGGVGRPADAAVRRL